MQEIWKDIEEFNGAYQISNYGRLKSVSRVVKHPKGSCVLKEKFLSQVVNKCGYIEYQITYNGKHYSRKAHRLVADAFIQNPENKLEINHIDGDKTNNRVSNLEWCTRVENVRHSYRHGLHKEITPIYQYTIDGELIKKWEHAGMIRDELGISTRSIFYACHSKRHYTHGYIWKREIKNGRTN